MGNWSIRLWMVGLAACASGALGCSENVSLGTDGHLTPVLSLLPQEVVDVDLLFVIDNSGSMTEEQESLASWAEDFLFGALDIDPESPLNLHVAVVSTDVGAGPYDISGCDPNGDNGLMQSSPRVAGCEPPAGNFIADVDDGAGGRLRNYQGTLGEAFSCIAQLGPTGCGFESPLESMRRALDGSHIANDGFLRDGALLAVVIVSDEDDCSARDAAVYDTSQSELDSELGPLSSFRCFEFGVVCDSDDPRDPGAKENCASREDSPYITPVAEYGASREDSPYITPVAEYADFLKSLKADPAMVVVGAIAGNPGPVVVGLNPNDGNPMLEASCSSDSGLAMPAVRIREFLDHFPARSKMSTICESDLGGPMSQVTARIADVASRSTCLYGPIDLDLDEPGIQMECRAVERTATTSFAIPLCVGDDDDCYLIDTEPSACAHTETQLALQFPNDYNIKQGGRVVVECKTR